MSCPVLSSSPVLSSPANGKWVRPLSMFVFVSVSVRSICLTHARRRPHNSSHGEKEIPVLPEAPEAVSEWPVGCRMARRRQHHFRNLSMGAYTSKASHIRVACGFRACPRRPGGVVPEKADRWSLQGSKPKVRTESRRRHVPQMPQSRRYEERK